MNDDTAISVEGVYKDFKLPHEKQNSLKGLITSLGKGKRTFEIQHTLRDINFEIPKGEFFGIIGRNGSGKSTLLKLLAGIYSTSKGRITVNGKLTPFIELGVGFNPELTGRENVFLNGALLGFSRKEMNTMYKDIVQFAELEKFMDQKLKNYSSGMQVRLAFSIAIRANSGILLFDEVLAVGDSNFQRKCIETFRKLKEAGNTIVFVSHDLATIEEFCDRVALINNGDLIEIGEPGPIIMQYRGLMSDTRVIQSEETNRSGTGEVKVTKLEVLDGRKVTNRISEGEPFSVRLNYKANKKIENPMFGLAIADDKGIVIMGPNTSEENFKVGSINSTGSITARFSVNPLSAGHYTFMTSCIPEDSQTPYDFVYKIGNLQIIGKERHGSIYIKPDWSKSDKSS